MSAAAATISDMSSDRMTKSTDYGIGYSAHSVQNSTFCVS